MHAHPFLQTSTNFSCLSHSSFTSLSVPQTSSINNICTTDYDRNQCSNRNLHTQRKSTLVHGRGRELVGSFDEVLTTVVEKESKQALDAPHSSIEATFKRPPQLIRHFHFFARRSFLSFCCLLNHFFCYWFPWFCALPATLRRIPNHLQNYTHTRSSQ